MDERLEDTVEGLDRATALSPGLRLALSLYEGVMVTTGVLILAAALAYAATDVRDAADAFQKVSLLAGCLLVASVAIQTRFRPRLAGFGLKLRRAK